MELTICTEVLSNIALIGRAVSTIEPRFTIRVLRTLNSTRKKLDKESLKAILNQAYPKGCTSYVPLLTSTNYTIKVSVICRESELGEIRL